MIRTIVTSAFIFAVCLLAYSPDAKAVCTYGAYSSEASGAGSFISGYTTCYTPSGLTSARVWIDTSCQIGFGCRRAAARQVNNCSTTTLINVAGWVFNVNTGSQAWRYTNSATNCTTLSMSVSGSEWFTKAKCKMGLASC